MSFVSAQVQEQINPIELPKLTQRVTDFSNTLTTSQLDDINTIAKSYEDETSNQVFVVLFPHRQGYELIDIWMKIFDDTGIGQKDKNNGLLLLISTEEKKIRIIVGYGLEWVYPDLVASQILENNIRPLVNNGDFYGSINAFYEKSKQVIAGEYVPDKVSLWSKILADDGLFWLMMLLFGMAGGFLLPLIMKFLPKKFKKNFQRFIWILLFVSFLFMIVGGVLFFVLDPLNTLIIKLPFTFSFGLIIGLTIGGIFFWLFKAKKWWGGSGWWRSSWGSWWSSSDSGSSWGWWWGDSGWGGAGD